MLHIADSLVRQFQVVRGGVALAFVLHGVTVVMVRRPCQRGGSNQQ
ncbi:hypothetical protein S305_005199 [Salmonella enterica subsp. enterica]|nr:hypothetical protein [Salmonella enterica subsp. enterica]